MTPRRRQRLLLVVLMLSGVSVAAAFGVSAFRQNLMLFHSPADIAAGAVESGRPFRVGGMVVDGSVKRDETNLLVRFDLTDHQDTVSVAFDGILPDLFREGQGIVAMGQLDSAGTFVASEVLAKHDENYMPPEVAEALEKAGRAPDTEAGFGRATLVDP